MSLYYVNCPFHVWNIMRHQKNAINIVPGGCIRVYLTTELYINEKIIINCSCEIINSDIEINLSNLKKKQVIP